MSMDFEIRQIEGDARGDINIPNEPFPLYGKMLVERAGGEWSFTTALLAENEVGEMTFPDENYDYDRLKKDCFCLGAYLPGGECAGLAIYRHSWNKYLYLYDLKVRARGRGLGIGRALIAEGERLAAAHGYNGIYTQAQDNNLAACLFYIKTGFKIGGLDTMVYKGTKQEGKSDIVFYLDRR